MPNQILPVAKVSDLLIDVYNPGELAYWSIALHTSDDELKRTVAEVGPMIADVSTKLNARPDGFA